MTDPLDLFDVVEKLGAGTYGSVYKARDTKTGKTVALKVIPLEEDQVIHQSLQSEIEILEQCESPYIVEYLGSYVKESNMVIAMEYCGGGSVADLVRFAKINLSEDHIACVLRQTLKGLKYLHSKNKIHRDIKCGNILLTSEGVAKLADFGVSAQLTETMNKRKTVIGTPYWMAPEVLSDTMYDQSADIWSLGITAIEMAMQEPPLSKINPMRAIFMIPMKPPPSLPSDQFSPIFCDFVRKCLKKNPLERPTAKKLLKHPFIESAVGRSILQDLIEDNLDRIEVERQLSMQRQGNAGSDDESIGTMITGGTASTGFPTGMRTMIENTGTIQDMGTMVYHDATSSTLPSYLKQYASSEPTHFRTGTLPINEATLSTAAEIEKAIKDVETARDEERSALEAFYAAGLKRLRALVSSKQ